MMSSTKVAQMVSFRWTKGPPELQIRNVFKRHLLLNHWSKFKIISKKALMMPSTKIAQMVPLHWKKGPPELQIWNIFKMYLLLNQWSNFKIISQNCSSWYPLPKWHKLFRPPEQKVRQRCRYEISLNDISSWTTGPNSKLFHRIVSLDTLFQNCTNGSVLLSKRALEFQLRNILKRHLLLNHWFEFKTISQNCSS